MTDPTADPHIEPTGQFEAWMKSLDLMGLWERTADLPTHRCDAFRREILRIYVRERRKAEKSQRFQLSRGRS